MNMFNNNWLLEIFEGPVVHVQQRYVLTAILR